MQQFMKEFQEQSAHCHDEPNIKVIWSLAKIEETVTESIVTTVLNMSLSGLLISIWAFLNIVK